MKPHIFTLTVFLLSLSVNVRAQALHNKDTLKGLREIPFIVKYDQAEGLPEEMRPSVGQVRHRQHDHSRI